MRTGRHRAGRSAWSVFLRIEELILASSGEDAFEVVFALVAARLLARRGGLAVSDPASVARALGLARRRWPSLELAARVTLPEPTLLAVVSLLDRAGLDGDAAGIDALFEQLVTRVGKGAKGQFFTPRHVVDFAIDALDPADGERFLDPACGSGAFALRARAAAKVAIRGYDIDRRAVRVARLLALSTGNRPSAFECRDSLSASAREETAPADVLATNPPFAGAADLAGSPIPGLRRAVERDVAFLARCVSWLAPGGRLAIVLPHGKVASPAWAQLRAWLVARARVLAVVSLPAGTFAPHTTLRTALLFARRRASGERLDPSERIFFGVSERSGKDASGEPVFAAGGGRRSPRETDHDLASLAGPLRAFLASGRLARGGDSRWAARTLGDLGPGLPMAPERHRGGAGAGVPLSDLAVEVRARGASARAVTVLDTTHARDGVLAAPPPRASDEAGAGKTKAPVGAVLVSRLRPYLRQVGLVTPSFVALAGSGSIVCSPEFSVLVAREAGESLAFLVPFLLSAAAQTRLAAGQEGGHRPRVPREALLALRVPRALVRARRATSARVEEALDALYAARSRLGRVLR